MKEDNNINKFDKNANQLTESDLAGVSGGIVDCHKFSSDNILINDFDIETRKNTILKSANFEYNFE